MSCANRQRATRALALDAAKTTPIEIKANGK
jgi:hypothetical protein